MQLIEEMELLHKDANLPLATTTWHAAIGTFRPCSLLAAVSKSLFVAVLVMVYLRLYSNQLVYLWRLDSNLLVSVNLDNILLVTVYWQRK